MGAYYFSKTLGSNTTGNGQINNPWQSFYAMKGAANAILPTDALYFMRGDEWVQEEMIIDSNGTALGRITIDAWGNPALAKPTFRWSVPQSGWTQVGATEIYFKTGLFAWPQTIGVDKSSALGVWSGANNTLPRGTFWVNGAGSIYIRLADGSNPSAHTIYVPPTYQSDGNRGIVRGSYTRGKFVDINNIRVEFAQGKGFSFSQPDSNFNDCEAIGCGADGFLMNGYTPNAEMADRCRANRCLAEHNCAGANFYNGMGQAYTTGASFTWFIDCVARLNKMAGFDFLDYGTDTNVAFGGCVRCVGDRNGAAQSDPSYDGEFYADGANNILFWGCVGFGGGTGTGTAGNSRTTFAASSEHPDVKPVHHIYFVNCWGHTTNWECFNSQNSPSTFNNIQDIYHINCTYIGYRGANSMVWSMSNMAPIADCIHFKNCIFYASGNYPGAVSNWVDVGTWLDADYNLYFRTNGNQVIYSVNNGANNMTLAQWKAAINDEAHSIFADPKFVNDVEGAYDVHLQRTSLGQAFNSPAIGAGTLTAFTPPAWIAAANVLPDNGAVAGTTRSDGVATAPSTIAMDIGYHYPATSSSGALSSANVQPATLVIDAVGTCSISFVTATAWPANGILEATFPTALAGGFIFNSGGTSAASFSSGGTGTLSTLITGAVVKMTRSGGAIIPASTSVVIALTNVKNPPAVGSTGAYQLKTTTSTGAQIDINSAVSADTIISPSAGYTPMYFEALQIENLGLNT